LQALRELSLLFHPMANVTVKQQRKTMAAAAYSTIRPDVMWRGRVGLAWVEGVA